MVAMKALQIGIDAGAKPLPDRSGFLPINVFIVTFYKAYVNTINLNKS
jgi:hypothetical protein